VAQAALGRLEMPRFTRRFPRLTDAVLRQLLALTHDYEAALLAAQADAAARRQQQQQQRQPSQAREGDEEPGEGDEADVGMEGGNAGGPSDDVAPGHSMQSLQVTAPLAGAHAPGTAAGSGAGVTAAML
jgi:hypothetical protein